MSESSRPPGWFVANGGKPLPGDRPEPVATPLQRFTVSAAAWGLVAAGLWLGLVPWSVSGDGHTMDCGLAITYGGVTRDIDDSLLVVCGQQAQHRELAGSLLIGAGIVVAAAHYLAAKRVRDRRRSPASSEPELSEQRTG